MSITNNAAPSFVPLPPLYTPRRRRILSSPKCVIDNSASNSHSTLPPVPSDNPQSSPAPFRSSKRSSLPQRPLGPLIPTSPDQVCGFAALLGPSNSGKSTLLNRILGQKVSIVTPKVQTTRCRVSGIATLDKTQIVFLDTPGIFSAQNRLSRAMVKSAWTSGKQADAIAVILDAAQMYNEGKRVDARALYLGEEEESILRGVVRRRERGHNAKICLVGNKIDAVPKGDRQFVKDRLKVITERFDMGKLFVISAKKGEGVEEFVDWVKESMPKGQWLYPEDDLTDMPSRMLAAEVTREKVFLLLRQELPYQIAVETSEYVEGKGEVRIWQEVLVARESQRIILLGKGGKMIKAIGMKARVELEEVLGVKVHLMLNVKVRAKWQEERKQYERWGLDFNA